MGETQDRELWADVGKGIAINHCGNGILSREPLPGGSPMWDFFTLYCYSFMVPVFFFVAGWFNQKRAKSFRQGLKAMAIGLIYPCALWTIIQGTTLHYINRTTIPLWETLYYSFTYHAKQFWFFRALLGLLLLGYLWRAVRLPTSVRVLVALGMYAVYLQTQLPTMAREILKSAIFFELGGLLAGFALAPRWLGSRTFTTALGVFA